MNESCDRVSENRNASGGVRGTAHAVSREQWWILGCTTASLVILGIAAGVATLWLPELPNLVAVHWGASMQADGFSSPQAFIAWTLGVFGTLVLVFAAIGFACKGSSVLARVAGGTQVFLASLGAFMVLLGLGIQRGLSDATGVQMPIWVLLLSVAAPAVAGISVAAAAPRTSIPNAPEGPAPEAPMLPAGDRSALTWRGRTSMTPGLIAGIGSVMVLVLVWISAATQAWWILAVAVPILFLILLEGAYRVQIDASGLRVRALLGWPNVFVSALQVQEASVVDVNPLQEFGGWGYRVRLDGTTGVVLRAGQALCVSYGDAATLVVTLDRGAADAAATLNTAADIAHGNPKIGQNESL